MKLRVGTELLDIVDGINHPTLRDLKYLIRESTKEGDPVTPTTMNAMFAGGVDSDDLLSNTAYMSQIQGVIWLARRRMGQDLTYQEAGEFDLSELEFVDDEVDATPLEEAADDPE